MAMTLLSIVQDILSDTLSDEVNSISDTTEAEQVARIVLSTYRGMVSGRNWPNHKKTFPLTSSGNSERPTHMTGPTNLKELLSVEYDKTKVGDNGRQRWSVVKWMENEDFLRLTSGRNSLDTTNVKSVTDSSGIKILILKNKAPEFFTSFNDKDLIFDSYDSSVDNTLQASKTRAFGYLMPTDFTMSDSFVPDLPDEAFSALLEESKAKAQYRVNSFRDPLALEDAQSQERTLSRKAWRINGGVKYPNFGRK